MSKKMPGAGLARAWRANTPPMAVIPKTLLLTILLSVVSLQVPNLDIWPREKASNAVPFETEGPNPPSLLDTVQPMNPAL